MTSRTIKAADLFCGAGGTSTGLAHACESLGLKLSLIAVNHWDIAIETHHANHPEQTSVCANLDTVDPRKLVPGGKLDLLVASPECTHHSRARGGKPKQDQSRASAWRVVEWASQIEIKRILIENVKEFLEWGPLGSNGHPLQRRKGETFQAWATALRSLGYTVEWRVLNAADYGEATSRERLFVQAVRGRTPLRWPEPTHAPAHRTNNLPLFADARPLQTYRPAREIIDWSLPSESIFTRKKPLSLNTLARIQKGLEKFCGIPFIVPKEGNGSVRSVDRPMQTVTCEARGIGLVQPFLVKYYGGAFAESLDKPLPAVTANYEHYGLAEPFLVRYQGSHEGKQDGDGRSYSLDEPLRTLDTSNRFALCQPFICVLRNNNTATPIDQPLTTICTSGAHHALVEPFLIQGEHGGRVHSINEPLRTIAANGDAWSVVQPFITPFYGTGTPSSVEEPLNTITTKDRFGLVLPEPIKQQGIHLLDIRFRMLQPHELAAAMGFPKSYVFHGNRSEKVRQVGNAVPVNLAKAIIAEMLKTA